MFHHPHDHLFKTIWSDRLVAAGHFQSLLHPALSEALDWSAIEPAPTELQTPHSARHTDLRFTVPLRRDGGAHAQLVLLFHHQSRPDRMMALRLAEEALLGLSRWRELHPRSRWLPWFLPMVVAHGRRRWTAPTDLRSLLVGPDLPGEASALLPSVPYLLQDLSVLPEEALGGTALGALGLRALKYAWKQDLWERLPGWERLLIQARQEHGAAASEPLLRYMMHTCPKGPDERTTRWLERMRYEREVTMVKSWAQRLHEEGWEEGLAEGHEKGLVEGHEKGARREREALVLRLLAARFGPLPEGTERRVREASDDQLSRAIDGIFQATTLDELLG